MDPIEQQLQLALAELRENVPDAPALVDDLVRLTEAGGRRIRGQLCRLAHLAFGGDDSPALHQVAAAMELLHLFALIQDDVMDASPSRRGAEASHVALRVPGEHPEHFGTSAALLAADLAFVWADRMVRTAAFDPALIAIAGEQWDLMRLAATAGQYLDVIATHTGAGDPLRIAELKTASYSFVGPLCIGAALAGPVDLGALAAFGRPLGVAYQLADDLADGDAGPDTAQQVQRLHAEARDALTALPGDAQSALAVLLD